MSIETKECPQCGMLAVRRETGALKLVYPALRETEWWCDCGYREPAPDVREMTGEEVARSEWQKAQEET